MTKKIIMKMKDETMTKWYENNVCINNMVIIINNNSSIISK
jgi:hypothetical protein